MGLASFRRRAPDRPYCPSRRTATPRHPAGRARRHAETQEGLADEIGFYDIYRLVRQAVEEVPFIQNPTLEEILDIDRQARENVLRHMKG